MLPWILFTVAAVSAGVLLLLLILIFRRCCQSEQIPIFTPTTRTERPNQINPPIGISKLHHHIHQTNNKPTTPKPNYSVFRRGSSARPLFNWSDNPSLVTDAVENGWSRFAFSAYSSSSPSVRTSSMWCPCGVAGDRARETEVDMNWEVCNGSADFIQKIRFNHGFKKINPLNSSNSAKSVIKTGLPLPGPYLGNSSFPQEAYFEITILWSAEDNIGEIEGEKIKLMKEIKNFNGKLGSESVVHVTSNNKLEEIKIGDQREEGGVVLAVGLTGGGSIPMKLPGSYPGSVGFNSSGSVCVDGIKLVFEAEKEDWGKPEKVIGCGYNPSQRKVFFTLDSELVHVIHCKSEEFGTPLYPTLAANTDITVLVNLGQSVFKYGPANLQRTPNPCFTGPLANSPSLGYEDSKELFSMGRIDSQWLNRSTTRGGNNNGGNSKGSEFDDESESDFFEIVLDSCGRSPNTVL